VLARLSAGCSQTVGASGCVGSLVRRSRAVAVSWVWIGGDLGLESVAVVVLVLVGTPCGEHLAGQLEALADRRSSAQPSLLSDGGSHAGCVTSTPGGDGVEMACSRSSGLRRRIPVVACDQLVELLAVAMLGDLKDRCAWGSGGPSALGSPAVRPAGLIDVDRVWVRIQSRSASCPSPSAALAADKSRPRGTRPTAGSEHSPASSAIPRREIRFTPPSRSRSPRP